MLEEKVLETIKKYELLKKGDTVIVGVSGGPDSMALLNTLLQLKQEEKIEVQIVVVHVNHGIRKEADEETSFVEKFCKEREIACYSKKEKVEQLAKEQKIGTEEAGRKLRYAFFEEIAKKVGATKIATAHHAGDNVETVLMNVLRGTGITGLKGIEPNRENKWIRPLIECNRQEIEAYCIEKKLNPKYDKTNEDNIYTRNKIRNLLIPYLQKEFNPNIIEAINRLSKIAAEESSFIEKLVKEKYEQLVEAEYLGKETIEGKRQIELSLKKFNQAEKFIKTKIILYTIQKLLGSTQNIEKIHIEDLIKLCQNNIGNKYLTPNKKLKVLVKNGKIFFIEIGGF